MSSSDENAPLGKATKLTRAGRRPEWTGRVVNPPVWRGSTHLYESEAQRKEADGGTQDGEFFYGRRGAPTQWALAQALTEIEAGAFGTVLYPSGVAAIAGALLAVLRPGDHLLMSDNAYDPSRSMATGFLKRFGITHSFFDPLDLDGFGELVEETSPRAVWFENPGSLTMEVCDVPALAQIARVANAVTLVDNTWASALGFSALEHGCDIVMQSLSKHVGGHSDLMMGSASAGERWYKALRRTSHELGQVVSPDDAALRCTRTSHYEGTAGARHGQRTQDCGMAQRPTSGRASLVPPPCRKPRTRALETRFHRRMRALQLCPCKR